MISYSTQDHKGMQTITWLMSEGPTSVYLLLCGTASMLLMKCMSLFDLYLLLLSPLPISLLSEFRWPSLTSVAFSFHLFSHSPLPTHSLSMLSLYFTPFSQYIQIHCNWSWHEIFNYVFWNKINFVGVISIHRYHPKNQRYIKTKKQK